MWGVSEQLEIESDKNVNLGFNGALCPCECVVVCRHASRCCILQIRCDLNCFECRHLVVILLSWLLLVCAGGSKSSRSLRGATGCVCLRRKEVFRAPHVLRQLCVLHIQMITALPHRDNLIPWKKLKHRSPLQSDSPESV